MKTTNPSPARTPDQPSQRASARSTRRGFLSTPRSRWMLLGGLFLLVLVVALLIPLWNRMTSGSAPESAQQLNSVPAGTTVTIALGVTALPSSDLLTGTLLERNADGLYHRTGKTVQVRWQNSTSIVMGQRQDVHVGAILQVRGRTTASGGSVVDADEIVILTGAVTVQ